MEQLFIKVNKKKNDVNGNKVIYFDLLIIKNGIIKKSNFLNGKIRKTKEGFRVQSSNIESYLNKCYDEYVFIEID